MYFSSYIFIAFLLVLLPLYYLVPRKGQWVLLLAASYFFYAFAGLWCFAYLLATTVSSYVCARWMTARSTGCRNEIARRGDEIFKEDAKALRRQCKTFCRYILAACLILNFGILFVLKYTNFAIFNLNSITVFFGGQPLPYMQWLLPLGISFYTFQTMGYLIDVYYEKYEAEKNPGKYALFAAFFPQMIQGPIGRYPLLSETLFSPHEPSVRNIGFGLQRILWGYFKKLVIADRILIAVQTVTASPEVYDGIYVFFGMLFYAVQLYADFTGGIDIAVGTAEMLGIRMSENFIRPFFSKSIAEYWRRWHISLGTWFRDYMFYPLSTSKSMMKLTKRVKKLLGPAAARRAPVYLASVIVWFTTGAWHGASWNFIVWGLLNCLFILAAQEFQPVANRFHEHFDVAQRFWYRAFSIVRTFLLLCFLRTLDCYASVGETFRAVLSVFTNPGFRRLTDGTLPLSSLGLTVADAVVIIVGIAAMLAVSLRQRGGSVRESLARRPFAVRYALFASLFCVILIFGAYGPGYDAHQFIYNQF